MNEITKMIGYHGTDKSNEDSILKNGFEESKPQKGHWLGRGVYFYENIYYAIEWGIVCFNIAKDKFKDYIKKSSVIKAVIDYDKLEVLDLNDPIGYIYYNEIMQYIKENFPKRIAEIEQDGDIQIIRLLEEIEEETGELYISMFDVVVANYLKDIYKKGTEKIKGNFLPCIQKQICVKNNKAIKQIEKVDLTDSCIEEYYNIIKTNRRRMDNEKQYKIIKTTARKNKKYSK